MPLIISPARVALLTILSLYRSVEAIFPQRRKGAKRYRVSKGFLCAFASFAPLREKYP